MTPWQFWGRISGHTKAPGQRAALRNPGQLCKGACLPLAQAPPNARSSASVKGRSAPGQRTIRFLSNDRRWPVRAFTPMMTGAI